MAIHLGSTRAFVRLVSLVIAVAACGGDSAGPSIDRLSSPLIDSITPASDTAGGQVTIHGEAFDPASVQIFFGSTPADRLQPLGTSRILAGVPESLGPGLYAVRVTNGDGGTSWLDSWFVIFLPTPDGIWTLSTLNGNPLPYHVRTEQNRMCPTIKTYITGSIMSLQSSGGAEYSVQWRAECIERPDLRSNATERFRGTWKLADEILTVSVDQVPPVVHRQTHFDMSGTFALRSVVLTEDIPPFGELAITELAYRR